MIILTERIERYFDWSKFRKNKVDKTGAYLILDGSNVVD